MRALTAKQQFTLQAVWGERIRTKQATAGGRTFNVHYVKVGVAGEVDVTAQVKALIKRGLIEWNTATRVRKLVVTVPGYEEFRQLLGGRDAQDISGAGAALGPQG